MRPKPGRTSPGTCQGFMGCRPMSRERQDAGHTARSCFVWPRHRDRFRPDRRMNVRSLALAAALLLGTACTAHRQLRTSTVPVDVTAPLSDPSARAAMATSSIERYPGYTIAIVEFDDQGRFWDRRQVAALQAAMTREARLPCEAAVV